MSRKIWLGILLSSCMSFGAMRAAHAQFAVIDVQAIAQLIEQIRILEEQLTQAQLHYEAVMGGRGMELLLADVVRNYLPGNWEELLAAIEGTGGEYGELAAQIAAIREGNAILTEEILETFSAPERREITAGRDSAASLQAISRQALTTTSERFEALQQLIGAIAVAEDPKAIMDLQARIQVEAVMLQNESTKLQVLHQTLQAQEWARQQREREQAMADIGRLRDLEPMGLTP